MRGSGMARLGSGERKNLHIALDGLEESLQPLIGGSIRKVTDEYLKFEEMRQNDELLPRQ